MYKFRRSQLAGYPMGQYIAYGHSHFTRDYLHLPDHGCEFSAKCVSCERPRCKHDEEQEHPIRKITGPWDEADMT